MAQLTYTNADIAEKFVRTQTTTTPVPTTKKSSFFGGIRNLFRKDSTTASSLEDSPTTSTTPTAPTTPTNSKTPTSTARTIASGIGAANQAFVAPVAPVRPTPSATTTQSSRTTPASLSTPTTAKPRQPLHEFESFATITLSTKPPKVKEDFPALPSRPNQREDFPALPTPRSPSNSGVLPASTAAPPLSVTANAWSSLPTLKPSNGNVPTPTTPPRVNFIPNGQSTTQRSLTTTTVSPGETTNAELETLTEALFTKETSLFSTVTLNFQEKTQSSSTADLAPLPLMTVDEATLEQNPTVVKLKLLYNNYEQDTAVNEHVTAMERSEENDLVDQLMASSVMRHAMKFLQQKGKVTLDPQTHRDLLKTIWFNLYSRGKGKIGSSAFEHVFLTELRNGTVSGFHNWIYYASEERAGNVDYQGWLKKVDLGNKGAIVKYRQVYKGVMKPVNTMFVGTSPELEVALYTVCFAVRADKECPVSMDGHRFTIRTHTFRYRGKNLIGSAFAEI